MSVSSEVQRTLVKSPPELWAELSCPEALARHLGDFGEIKITSVEPETKVEWEAEDASGIVHLKQSGWGTKVTLSVTRNAGVVEDEADAEPVTVPEPEPAVKPETEAVAETEIAVEVEAATAEPEVATVEATTEVEPEPAVEPKPEPKLGFFARLFRKRKTEPTIVVEPEPIVPVEPEIESKPEPEVVAMAAPEPIYPEPPPEPVVDLAAELASMEAQMTEETTELLTTVLDRLGAAHHRPFSRG
jgi:hypothetical protein